MFFVEMPEPLSGYPRWRAAWRSVLGVFGLLVCLLVASCSISLPYVDPYSAEIETELNTYHKETVEFLKAATQGKAQANFASDAAKTFYATETARLANLVIRAQAIARRDRCAGTHLAALTAKVKELSTSGGETTGVEGKPFAGSFGADVSLEGGSCAVVALKVVQANQNKLEAMHKRSVNLSTYQAALSSDLITDSVRIALKIETANKP
jgi:hypothetical protein